MMAMSFISPPHFGHTIGSTSVDDRQDEIVVILAERETHTASARVIYRVLTTAGSFITMGIRAN